MITDTGHSMSSFVWSVINRKQRVVLMECSVLSKQVNCWRFWFLQLPYHHNHSRLHSNTRQHKAFDFKIFTDILFCFFFEYRVECIVPRRIREMEEAIRKKDFNAFAQITIRVILLYIRQHSLVWFHFTQYFNFLNSNWFEVVIGIGQ
jgi:hypothetical protein